MMHHRIRKIRNCRRERRLLWLKGFRRDERGVQLVELALALPILLMLFGAAAEFGRYFYEYTTVAKAARVGARYLITQKPSGAADSAAASLVVYGNTSGSGTPILSGLTTGNVRVVRQGGSASFPETVTVQIVDFKHQPVFDLGKMLNSQTLSMNVDVKPSVTMRFLLK
jgi:Flp pilus assembly protein TadG